VRSQHSFREIISARHKKIDTSVQCRVVEIDDVLALAESLTSELPTQSRIALPLSQHGGRAKLRRIQRANLVGIAFNRRPSTPSGWQAGKGPRISDRCGDVREAGRRPALPRASATRNARCCSPTAGADQIHQPMPPVKNSSRARVLLLAICLPEINLLSHPKDGALLGRYI
jgi:hypothetical protein